MLSFWFLLENLSFIMLRVAPAAGSFPRPLSPAEEQEALRAMKSGDARARERLIEHNLRLVAHVVKKYYAAREDQDDLISIGTIGLIKAVSTYDPEKKIRLATYACRCIENEILMYFRAQRKQSQEVSLSEPIDSDGDGNSISLLDVIACDDRMLEEIELSDRQTLLYRYLEQALEAREREILTLRYGLGGGEPLTQRDTARRFGISRSYVSRSAYCKCCGIFCPVCSAVNPAEFFSGVYFFVRSLLTLFVYCGRISTQTVYSCRQGGSAYGAAKNS